MHPKPRPGDALIRTASRPRIHRRLAITGALLALISTTALAGFSQDDILGAGGFLSAYSGVGSGVNPDPGFDLEPQFVEVNVDEDSFGGSGFSSAASSYSFSAHSNGGSGAAGFGFVSFNATAESMHDFSGRHSRTWVHGGWTDTITITAPGFAGQTAIWRFRVNAHGELAASGFSGFPGIEIEPYLNHDRLPITVPGVDLGDSDPVATSVQHAQWYLVLGAIGASQTRTVDDTVTFAAEIVIGEAFDLGVFAIGLAHTSDSSAFPSILSTADLHTGSVTWGGSAGLSINGVPVANFDVQSAAGVNWVQPIPAGDYDMDAIANIADNCLLEANPGQNDTDGDGIGNACDPDITPQPNDCFVDFSDLAALKLAFFSSSGASNWNADADFDGSGMIDFIDLSVMKAFFFQAPGPSGQANTCP